MTKPRQVSKVSYTVVDIYNESKTDFDYKTWKDIISVYYDILYEGLIKGDYISLPYNMGIIYLKKYKPKSLPADRQESKKQGKFVPMLNMHTDGYQTTLNWDKRASRIPNKNLFKFRFVRKKSRELANMLKTGQVNIYDILK